MSQPQSTAGRLPRWRADLLKLRKSRGLVAVVALTTFGASAVAYGVTAILHAVNPDSYGAAGGVANFGQGIWLLSTVGGIAAIITGAKAGADDTSAGVFRDLVSTGCPRLLLFAIRLPSGLALLAPFVTAGFLVAVGASLNLNGDLAPPSTRLLLVSGLWLAASISFWYLLALGVASLLGSRGYTIASLLGFRLAVSQILSAIGALGGFRGAVPSRALEHFLPGAIGTQVREGPIVHQSGLVALLVITLWLIVALSAGAWRTARRDA